jgi:hypothetical protein
MSVWPDSVGWMAPWVISALIAGPRSAVIQSRFAGWRSSRMRALVIIPRSPTRATWASPNRCLPPGHVMPGHSQNGTLGTQN